MRDRTLWGVFCLFGLAMGMGLGCDGGGSGGPVIGRFLDSPVAGLSYETPTQSGTTDGRGYFYYEPDQTIRFFIGALEIGRGMAASTMTPMDISADPLDESDPAVINRCRLLRSLDTDGDPENGIAIAEAVADQTAGIAIDFDQDPDFFAYDPQVMALFDRLNRQSVFPEFRSLVSAEDALAHFRQTLRQLALDDTAGEGGGGGDGDGADGGSGGDSGGG